MSWQARVIDVAEDLLTYSQNISMSLPDANYMALQSARLIKIVEQSRKDKNE